MKTSRSVSLLATLSILTSALVGINAANASQSTPPDQAVGYWTESKMRNAKPIELVLDRKTGVGQVNTLAPSANVTGENWEGGLPQTAVGKVFFSQGGLDYVCSGALITESISQESIVLTAGHCVIDKGRFSTNFAFVPNYDQYVTDGTLTQNVWYASNLIVRKEFADARQFNTTAVQHDWAFAVLPTGKFTKDKITRTNGITAPDSTFGSFELDVAGFKQNTDQSTAFGYPAAAPFNGKELKYASGPIFTDGSNGTWGMPSDLTGGASGGPWLSNFDGNRGGASSLNSYKYNVDSTKMYGPKFNSKTSLSFTVAIGATGSSNLIDSSRR